MVTTWLFTGVVFAISNVCTSQVAQITLTVKVGQHASMPCHSRITTPVDWFYKPSDSTADQQVCIKGEVVGTFRGKVWVDTSTPTYFNLIINNTRESDAGIYTCIEDAGLGPGTFVTRLSVSAANVVVQTTSAKSDASSVTAAGRISQATDVKIDDYNATTGTLWSTSEAYIMTGQTSVSAVTRTRIAVKVGQYVSMKCHTRIATPVDWFYKPSDTGADQQVSIKGEVVGRFRGMVWVDTSTPTYFNLIINSTRESDAGIYTCIEDAGLGPGTFVTRLNMVNGFDDEPGPSKGATVAIVIVILVAALVAAIITVWRVRRIRKPEKQRVYAACMALINRELNKPTFIPNTVKEKAIDIEQSPRDLLNTAMAEMQIRQTFMHETKSLFSSSSLPQGLQEAILAKALKGLAHLLKHSDGTPEINALILLTEVSSVWCRLIVNCDKEFRPRHISDIQTQNEVIGVACLDSLIFIVCNMSNDVDVYSESAYSLITTINVPKMLQPVDVISWIETRSIVIADFKGRCIWLVQSNGNTSKWRPWLCCQICRPCSLSVVMGQLAVATDDHRMRIFNQNHQQVRCFRFNSNADPHSAVMITNDKLAVYIPKRLQHAALRKPDNRLESVVFSRPFHLTFDDRRRCFFSDVTKNCVFLLYEKEMRKCRLLLSPEKDNLRQPRRMCCMDSSKKLLICDLKSVNVYELKLSPTWNLPLLRYLRLDMDMFQSGSSATLTTTPSPNVN